jgi:hypothetical protein
LIERSLWQSNYGCGEISGKNQTLSKNSIFNTSIKSLRIFRRAKIDSRQKTIFSLKDILAASVKEISSAN